ncbi:MAG: Rne/Rng family ribonuclease [Cellvibrionaceae bacterium]
MSDEILVNVSPTETRVAHVENGLVQEVFLERTRNRGLMSNIYKGKVVRVLPGMQAAFVDIGLERAGFIHASDFAPSLDLHLTTSENTVTKDIRELVREGQSLLVQIVKEPISTKGPRLTTQISISTRNLVFMPNANHIGISARIENEDERERLKDMLQHAIDEYSQKSQALSEDRKKKGEKKEKSKPGGFIVRTVAEGCAEEEISADIPFLIKLWDQLAASVKHKKAPAIIYEDLSLYKRTLRDLVKPKIEKVRIDSTEAYQRMVEFGQVYTPEILPKLELYKGDRPLFDLNGVEDEIERALQTQVQLKSGGYLIIEQTEAMTTIDVNTGAFVGNRNLEETIFKTNLEAATSIARQLRLRNLGGIIILDFIDMEDEEHQRQVLRTLEKAMERDRAKTSITGVSDLGLIEMTRKRTRESLGQLMCESCSVCQGRGILKTPQTVCYEIFREIMREARVYDNEKFLVLAAQSVVDCLLDEESAHVADLETFIGRVIEFRVEGIYNQEQYDIILV